VSENTTIGHVWRRPAVVLFASYNWLQPGEEADSFAGLSLLRTEIIEPQIQKFGGRMIRWTGDEVLLEFESVVEAVRCAVALGEAVSQLNHSLRPDRLIALRIGINLADIIVEGVKFSETGSTSQPGSRRSRSQAPSTFPERSTIGSQVKSISTSSISVRRTLRTSVDRPASTEWTPTSR
jgi:class 3 adenylate cyclase